MTGALTIFEFTSRSMRTETSPLMPCRCAISGVSTWAAETTCGGAFGTGHVFGVGVGGGGGAGGAVDTVGATAAAAVDVPCGTPLTEPVVCEFAASLDRPLFEFVFAELILIFGFSGSGVCGGGVSLGGGVGGGVGVGLGVGFGVGGGVGMRSRLITETFSGSGGCCLICKYGPIKICNAIEIMKPYSKKRRARCALVGCGGGTCAATSPSSLRLYSLDQNP